MAEVQKAKSVYTFTCNSYFQDTCSYYCSNSDVMCHVTMYCSMIGPHYTVRTLLSLQSMSSLQDCDRHTPSYFLLSRYMSTLTVSLFILPGDLVTMKLTLTTPMYRIAKMVAAPNSGLEVKDRVWLKMTIPKSFIGMSYRHATEKSVLSLALEPLLLT